MTPNNVISIVTTAQCLHGSRIFNRARRLHDGKVSRQNIYDQTFTGIWKEFTYLFIYLFIYLLIYLSTCLFIFLFIYIFLVI